MSKQLEKPVSESSSKKILTGDSAILAKRYASALYELAAESNQVDAIAGEVVELRSLYRDNKDFRQLIGYPLASRAKLTEIMQQVAKTAGFSKNVGNFLALLAQNRRLNILEGTIDAFMAQVAAARGEVSAEVHVAQALNAEQEQKLVSQLQKAIGGKIQLDIKQEPSLLGGMTVRLGSRFIDASLKGKLARIEKQLKAQQEAA